MKILPPYLTISDTTSEELLEHFIAAFQECKPSFPTQPLLVWMGYDPVVVLSLFKIDILVCYMIYNLKAWSYCILLKRTQIQNFIFLLWEETEICVILALHLMTSTVIVEAFFICAQFREQSMLWGWLYADLGPILSVPSFYPGFLCSISSNSVTLNHWDSSFLLEF